MFFRDARKKFFLKAFMRCNPYALANYKKLHTYVVGFEKRSSPNLNMEKTKSYRHIDPNFCGCSSYSNVFNTIHDGKHSRPETESRRMETFDDMYPNHYPVHRTNFCSP